MKMKVSSFSKMQQEVYENIQFRINENGENLLDAVYVTIKNFNLGPLGLLIDESDLENVIQKAMIDFVK